MRVCVALLGALLAAAGSGAERKPVAVETPASVQLSPGGSSEARIAVVVSEGFHLQANPASEKYLVATALELEKSADLRAGKAIYPPGRRYRLQGSSSDLLTYEGRFEIRLPLEASAAAKPGERILTGKLHYQACDAKTCLFPAFLVVRLPVTIARSKPAQ